MMNVLLFAVIAAVIPGVHLTGFWAMIVVPLVFGLLNAILRPILLVLTLPLNILTFGLFTFIVNGMVMYATSGLVSGFLIDNFMSALLASILLSIGQSLIFQKSEKQVEVNDGVEIYSPSGRRIR